MNTCQGCRNGLTLCRTVCGNVWSCMYHKQENCLDTCFLRLMFPLKGLFLFLIVSLQDPFQCLKSLFRVHSGRLLSYSKKRKIRQNDHSLSFVVIRCHSLYHSFITRCHSLSIVVTRCITRLSFYKRSDDSAPF